MSAARPTARRILGQVIYIFVFFSLAFAVLPARAAPGELVLERVMLSSGGVGYFEYSAEVEGDTELALKVNLDQVDDVLKSIVIYDDAGGVGQVRLPGREPLTQVFRDLPFGPDALESPAALLNSLQGAEIRATGDRDLVGRILGARAETVTLPNGLGTTVRHRVSLITPEGVRQFILEQAETVAFTDPELQAQVNEALEAIAAHRVQDSRTLKIAAEGEGRRTVRVGYVIAVPLWKTSYRLRLPAVGEEGPARLRGWAHVDNLSGQDWNGVELTLVSGNPVTFRQALYSAYFVDRPEVPVEVLGRVLPRLDQGVIASREKKAAGAGGQAFDQEFRLQQRLAMGRLGGALLESRQAPAMAKSQAADVATAAPMDAILGARPLAPAAMVAAQAQEATTQVVFRVTRPVTVADGQSLMVPIADREMPGARLALYQPATHALHPLAAVRLVNDGETGLPPGSLTLYEIGEGGATAYIGDARLSVLPAGDERLVSFALDQKVRIDRENKAKQRILKGRINKGILELTLVDEQTTLYRIKGPAREPRRVLIEQPVRAGWKIIAPGPEDVELTESYYRIHKDLEADSEATVEVILQRSRLQTIQLVRMTDEQLVAYAKTGELDPELREAIARIGDLRHAVSQHQRRLDQSTNSRKRIFEEQQRIRNNLGRIPSNSDLYRRYLKKLNQQEDKLERIDTAMTKAQDDVDRAKDALTNYIAGLDM
ncbi:MAG: DUF4139 domain-containing protein [Proteobacteria bacterium]|nr:DUF4139 domain-containing protein [Pseudomonadota bacterium]